MKGDIGTILYIVFLILISVAGMFRKKKKVDMKKWLLILANGQKVV